MPSAIGKLQEHAKRNAGQTGAQKLKHMSNMTQCLRGRLQRASQKFKHILEVRAPWQGGDTYTVLSAAQPPLAPRTPISHPPAFQVRTANLKQAKQRRDVYNGASFAQASGPSHASSMTNLLSAADSGPAEDGASGGGGDVTLEMGGQDMVMYSQRVSGGEGRPGGTGRWLGAVLCPATPHHDHLSPPPLRRRIRTWRSAPRPWSLWSGPSRSSALCFSSWPK